MNDPLAVIYNEGYWRVNEVSPMYNLQYSELKLKQYASKIRQAVVSRQNANADSQWTVFIENLPLLKYSHDDPNGLMITVKNHFKSNEKEVYVGILLSWGNRVHIDIETTHLPYMLERGEKSIGFAVKNTMQTVFDCTITPFFFTQIQLVEFMFNFIEYDTSRSSDYFVLTYQSLEVDFKNKTTFTFEIGDVRTIWNSSKETNMDQDKKMYAYQIIQNEIYNMFTIELPLLSLCEVVLPKAEVKYCGIVKMKTPEIINAVFTVLNEITHGRFQLKLACQNNEEETG